MNVVVDRDYKICNPGEWDGEWLLIAHGEQSSTIEQPGRGRRVIATSLLRVSHYDTGTSCTSARSL